MSNNTNKNLADDLNKEENIVIILEWMGSYEKNVFIAPAVLG